MRMSMRILLATLLSALAAPALAQSPNTAAIVIVVVDQTGGVVGGANVEVVNSATGATREVVSGSEGAATVSALPLTGTYIVRVTKSGFTAEDVTGLTLRAGETATVKVRLVASGGETQVTVFGTEQGVRADSQIGRRLDSPTIDETPILGRKLTTLPLFNSAFRQGKGTGDLFVNATYFVTASGSRRTTTFMLDGASNDEAWGRQTMLATVPVGAVQEISILSNAFSSEFGWTSGPALNIVTKSGTNAMHGEGLYMARPGGTQAETFSTDGFCPSSTPELHDAEDAPGDQPGRRARRAESVLRIDRRTDLQGQDVLLRQRRLHAAGSDHVPVADAAGLRAAAGRQSRLRRQLPPGTVQRPRRSQAHRDADLDGARELRSFLRHQPQRCGRSAPTRRR